MTQTEHFFWSESKVWSDLGDPNTDTPNLANIVCGYGPGYAKFWPA